MLSALSSVASLLYPSISISIVYLSPNSLSFKSLESSFSSDSFRPWETRSLEGVRWGEEENLPFISSPQIFVLSQTHTHAHTLTHANALTQIEHTHTHTHTQTHKTLDPRQEVLHCSGIAVKWIIVLRSIKPLHLLLHCYCIILP